MKKELIEIKASELRSEWGLSPYDPVLLSDVVEEYEIEHFPIGKPTIGALIKKRWKKKE
jgi:hypothetical protein